jgi:ABC-2 type transport system ATP-binding protein
VSTEDIALSATGLGRRYRRGWALRDCGFELPAGRIAALVGPNGAGKSTLMRIAAGVVPASAGEVRVFGDRPGQRGIHPRLGFLAQDKPLYPSFTVAEMMRAGRSMNARWDSDYVRRLIDEAGVPLGARISTLSGGQRTRVALAAALGRHPDLLMLDEPLADLDPLARTEVMQTLMAEAAEHGLTVLLSSHVLSELDTVCDYLLLLIRGEVRLSGEVDDVLAQHALMVGRAGELPFPPEAVVENRTAGRQATVLVRSPWSVGADDWQRSQPTLEEVTLAYLRSARDRAEEEVAA